jgi:signal peptidase I
MSRDAWIILAISLGIIGFLVGVIVHPTIVPFFSSITGPDLKGHDYRFIMNDTSMQPIFDVGIIVYVDVVSNTRQIEIDDIIALHSPYNWDTYLIHRVVERIETSGGMVFRTKGDANPVRDPWTLQDKYVIGIVVEYE